MNKPPRWIAALLAAWFAASPAMASGIGDWLRDIPDPRDADVELRQRVVGHPAEAVAAYNLQRGTDSAFDRAWGRVDARAGRISSVLGNADDAVKRLGKRLVREAPLDAAERARYLARAVGSLGVDGVAGLTTLSLRGLAEATFSGIGVGMLAIPGLRVGWCMAAGLPGETRVKANGEKLEAVHARPDTYFQRTGTWQQDVGEERRVAIENLRDDLARLPATLMVGNVLQVLGGFAGALAGTTLLAPYGLAGVAGTLVISGLLAEGMGLLGRWIGSRLDQRAGRYARLERKLADRARRAFGGDGARAEARAREAGVLLRTSQPARNIRFVAELREVAVTRDQGRVVLRTADGWSQRASPRFDFVDASGRRAVWDPAQERLVPVGRLANDTGRRVAFADSAGLHQGGDALVPGDGPRISQDGRTLLRGPERWRLVGAAEDVDLVVRGSGARSTWDGERYRLLGGATASD